MLLKDRKYLYRDKQFKEIIVCIFVSYQQQYFFEYPKLGQTPDINIYRRQQLLYRLEKLCIICCINLLYLSFLYFCKILLLRLRRSKNRRSKV